MIIKRIGVWLEEPVFTHGQLYVAASRVGNPTNHTTCGSHAQWLNEECRSQ